MQIGLFSNGNRNNALAKTSYDEDLHEVILADRLGISEAWISEHGTFLAYQRPDQMPSADLFICKAAALTKQIRMGPGIRPLPFFHPLQIATDCAVCDHLTDGRYIAGFGVGINAANNKQRGTLAHDPRVMFREAVELILKSWEAPEPFDWNGTVWQGEKWHIIPKPMTELEVGIACSRTDTTLELTAEKGFLPLMSWTPTVAQIREMLGIYMSSEHKRGPAPARSRARVGRVVYVCNSVAEGQARPARRRAGACLRAHAAHRSEGRQQCRPDLREADRPRLLLLRRSRHGLRPHQESLRRGRRLRHASPDLRQGLGHARAALPLDGAFHGRGRAAACSLNPDQPQVAAAE